MKAETRLSSKGQIVIPKNVRERLRWRPGMRLRIEASAEGVLLRTESASLDGLMDQLAGCLADDALSALEDEHRAEIEDDERRRR